ncbi:peptidoglycan-binding protein [Candidatus Kaiserbacteria bacterium]|nr:peptidoglycan-binding protein [Candidatus Kaiserbacteria bacterium]
MRYVFAVVLAVFLSFLAPFVALAVIPSLTLGDSGSDVTALQSALISKGYLARGNAIGYFGTKTDAALKKFQCAQKIACNASVEGYGVYGPATQAALQIALAPTQPATISGGTTGRATGAFEISGWLPGWRTASSTADVLPHLSQMKSVMPFGYNVNADGTIQDKYDFTAKPWKNFIAAAKAAHVRVIPSVVWGSGTEIQAVLSDATKRVALEDTIAALVKKNGFDGIDIDFEAKKSETINYFSTFLKGLYQRLGTKWLYCTVEARAPLEDRYSPGATIPPDATQFANDYTQMNKYCDRIEIMAYDQGTVDVRLNTARSAPYAPVADPGWVETVATLASQSISKNKLIIGIPTYGYEYTVTPLPGGGQQYKMLWPFNPVYATDIAQKLGITARRTSANELGFTYDPKALAQVAPANGDSTQTQQQVIPATSVAQNLGTQVDTTQPYNYMTWSDVTAIADKVALAHKLGVRGVAIFSLGGAEDQAMWSVLK